MPLYEKTAVAYRAAGILLLYLLWIRADNGLAGLFLLILLVILMLLRWRFPKLKWTLLLDQLAVMGASAFLENSGYAFILSVFEAVYLGCPFFTLPAAINAIFYQPQGFLWLLLAQSVFAGIGLWGWRRQQESALLRMDEERRRRLASGKLSPMLCTMRKQKK